MLISILVPAFNESATVGRALERIFAQRWPGEIEVIVVDDASSDGTERILEGLRGCYGGLRVIRHGVNRGKGAAIRTAIQAAGGDIVAVQDADLEYDPADLVGLLDPILRGEADVVYGSRFLRRCDSPLKHRLANGFLTMLSNVFTGLHLTDMETCYKVICRNALDGIALQSDRFGMEPELTAKLAGRGVRFCERPISYRYRDYSEGKKIGWRDGVRAVVAIVYFHFRVASW